MSDEDNTSWAEWRNHVLAELIRLNDNYETLSDKHRAIDEKIQTKYDDVLQRVAEIDKDFQVRVAILETKAGIYGGVAGFLGPLVLKLFENVVSGG